MKADNVFESNRKDMEYVPFTTKYGHKFTRK
jgi:hypothetical protein